MSSGGFDKTGQTVNLVAPGDLSFASCSTDVAIYSECTNFTGAPSDVEESGGTSESSPLWPVPRHLVIQAYRADPFRLHAGPGARQVDLVSTATDLGAPATEQGAGLLNSYAAVKMAESISTEIGSPAPHAAGHASSRPTS